LATSEISTTTGFWALIAIVVTTATAMRKNFFTIVKLIIVKLIKICLQNRVQSSEKFLTYARNFPKIW